MTNLEFVSMIDKLHEVKTDKNWKLYALLGGGALLLIAIAFWKKGKKISGQLSICQSELGREKAISCTLRSSNSELTEAVSGKDQYIKELKRENQEMARKIAEDNLGKKIEDQQEITTNLQRSNQELARKVKDSQNQAQAS